MSKKSKFLKTLTIFGTVLAAPLLLTGCTSGNENKTDPQNFRVQDGWVQFTQDGETWENLIKAEYPISEYDFRIQDGYVQWTTDGETWENIIKAETKTYTVRYDYGVAKDLFEYDAPDTSSVEENVWVMDLPSINYKYQSSFMGWFIQGTEKQITKYDYIAGDVTLVARFDFTSKYAPSGLYENGKYIKTWQQLLEDEEIVVEDGVLTYGYTQLGDLKIDNTVTEIGEDVFSRDATSLLTGVSMTDSVTRIGRNAFWLATRLETIIIGDKVESIGEYAFGRCENLKTITIPSSVVLIEDDAFYSCNNLTNIQLNVNTNRTWKCYFSEEIISQNCLSLTDKELASYLKNGYKFKQVGLHDTKEDLDFVHCADKIIVSGSNKNMTEIIIEDIFVVEKSIIVDEYAFADCELLKEVVLGDGITKIGNRAFFSCKELLNVVISDSVMEIDELAFGMCYNLTTITFEEKEGHKWQVYVDDEWVDCNTLSLDEILGYAKAGRKFQQVEIE